MTIISTPARRGGLAAALLTSGALALAAAPAHAVSVLCGDLAGWGGSTPSTPQGSLRSGNTCFTRLEPTNGGLIIAEADSDRGIVRAASTVILPTGVSHIAQSSAAWEEAFWVINHPDPAKQGTSGRLNFEFFIEGTLNATGAGAASMLLQVEGGQTSQRNLLNIGTNSNFGPRVVNSLVEGAVFFTFGQSSNFTFRLVTRAERRSGVTGEGFAEAIFNKSAYFGGITSVEDADGILTGFTFGGPDLNFESTFTTSTIPAPVPLPASVWLLGTGVAGLLWRRRAKAAG